MFLTGGPHRLRHRGALDVRASAINEEMKVACVHALRELAKEPVTDEVLNETQEKGEATLCTAAWSPCNVNASEQTSLRRRLATSAVVLAVSRTQTYQARHRPRQWSGRRSTDWPAAL